MAIPEKRTLADLELYTYAEKVLTAHESIHSDKYLVAKTIISDLLSADPEDVQSRSLWAELEMKKANYGMAYRLLIDLEPSIPKDHPRLNHFYDCIGHCLIMLWRHDEAIEWLEKSIEYASGEKHDPYVNLAMANLWTSRYDETIKLALKALELQPGSPGAIDNLACAQLALGEWAQGWDNYEIGLGRRWRLEYSYGDEPRWDGEEGHVVVVAPEQGLGDEILFCSMLGEAQKICSKLIVECDARLEQVLARSFPGISVYGTRWDKAPVWKEEQKPEFRTTMPTLARFFRREAKYFPGTRYLVADPVRHQQWKQYLDGAAEGKLKVGIAWTGGTRLTGVEERSIPVAELDELLSMPGCYFVDLEYKDRWRDIEKAGVNDRLHRFPWATLGDDYENTISLVSALDLVICVPTTIAHVAGGLGIPCWVLANARANWRFGPGSVRDNRFIWHKSVELFRQKERKAWGPLLQEIKDKLHENLHRNGREAAGRGDGADVIHCETPIQADRANPAIL